jgi:uncharacterized protein YndB with AHSA1/START domain
MKWIVRLLGVVVVLIVLAVVVLAVMGMREGSDQLKASIEINRPAADVWPWITQPEKQKQWVSWLIDIKPVGEKKDGVGARSIWVMEDKNNNNALMEITGEITASDPGKYVAVKLWVDGGFDGTASYTLVDLGGGKTRMESAGKYHFQSAFARLMTPLIMPQAAKKMNSDLLVLKEKVESSPAAIPMLEQTSAPLK